MSIAIPTDDKPSRIHRAEPRPTEEDVRETLAEYERLAIETGARVQIDPPEFALAATSVLGPGPLWAPWWVSETPPDLVRVTVWRDGTPTQVYRAWGESAPVDAAWLAMWLHRPMTFFGASAIRAALRRAYRDVIGDRREPDDVEPEVVNVHASVSAAVAPRLAARVEVPAKTAPARVAGSAPKPHPPRTDLTLSTIPVKPGSQRKADSRRARHGRKGGQS